VSAPGTLPELHPALRQSLFIAGTDTGVGKTFVATRLITALAAAGHRVAGMKPVAAGAEWTSHGLRNDDALDLAAAGSLRLPYELVNPVCLPEATSPHLAAERVGKSIDVTSIVQAFDAIRERADVIIVEGAGGWLAPIGPPTQPGSTGPTMQEVALALCHALLTAAAIERSGLPLAGWIANPVDRDFRDGPACMQSLQARLFAPLLWTAPQVILPGQ